MNKRNWTIGLAFSFVIALANGRAEAKDIPWKGSFSGSFVTTQTDTNGDGQKAFLSLLGFKGTLGSSTDQSVTESVISQPATTTCESGNAGLNLELAPPPSGGAWSYVNRFDKTGDLIFGEYTSVAACLDSVTLIQFYRGTFSITGGTGRFEGATGTGEFSGTARVLFDDGEGNFFGKQNGTYTATIVTP